jgi:phosphatidylcholine synthase
LIPRLRQTLISRTTAAWLVHLYTSTGGIIGLFALLFAADGQARVAFFLLVIAMLVDSTDGIMARRVNVREVTPNFDGAMVDNVVDVLTYVWVPVFIMVYEGLLPHPLWLVIPVMASLYAYGQVNMKTEDSFFLGFPSYWNVIALYLYWLQPPPVLAVLMIIVPGVLTFVPTRYLYPSRNRILWRTSWVLAAIWFLMLMVMLAQEQPSEGWVLLSLFFPAYYMITSFYVDWRIRHIKGAL